MRTLLALLIFGLSASANATLIQYDVQGTSLRNEAVQVSLLLDTDGASLSFTRRTDADENPFPCFFTIGVDNLGGQILGASVNGAPILGDLVGIPGAASIGGQFRNIECANGGNPLAGALMIAADAYQLDFFFFTSFALPPPDELLAMADPISTALLSQHGVFLSNLDVRSATGNLDFQVDNLSVREVTATVPEPSSLMLLLLGLPGLAMGVRRRSSPPA